MYYRYVGEHDNGLEHGWGLVIGTVEIKVRVYKTSHYAHCIYVLLKMTFVREFTDKNTAKIHYNATALQFKSVL